MTTAVQLHAFSGIGTLVTAGVVAAAVWWAQGEDEDDKPKDPYADMEVIDAALAEKAPSEVVQPVKPTKQPTFVKPEGVIRDAETQPVSKPEDPKRDGVPNIDDILKKNRDDDDDLEDGPATQPVIGKFDGSEDGFGDETRGDPYLGALKSDLLRGWEYPEILSDVGTPVGCIHLEPDGTIPEVVLREKSGNEELDDSVERAMRDLKKKRDAEPKAVPAHLIPKTRKWICYRMKV